MPLSEAYLGLFFSALIAATLLPAYSEVLLLGLWAAGYEPLALWCWATLGNSLGAVLNWLLGRYCATWQDHPGFPFSEEQVQRAQNWFQRYGVWSLLLSWAPLFGDGLTFIAGLLGVRFSVFFGLTAAGKGARYGLLLGLAVGLGGPSGI